MENIFILVLIMGDIYNEVVIKERTQKIKKFRR